MGTKDIKQLLGKYYDGATSKDEERQLEAFFQGNDIPAELAADQAYFRSLGGLKAMAREPEGLEQRLAAMLDAAPPCPAQAAAGIGPDTEAATAATTGAPQRRARMASMVRRAAGMAASVAAVALLGAYLLARNAATATAEQATYAQAQAAILKFSATLNKGFDQMEMANEKAKDVSRQINQCIELN